MGRYVIIESRDPFDSQDVTAMYELAEGLAREGSSVTLFLVQNGVLPVRQGCTYAARLAELAAGKRVAVVADDFSLRERGIGRLAGGVTTSGIDELVDLMMSEGTKTIWH